METYRADADAMTAVAGGLDEAAEQARAAADVLAGDWYGPGADGYGPGGLAEAVGELTGVWQGRLTSVFVEVSTAAGHVRSARDAYLDADSTVAARLDREGG